MGYTPATKSAFTILHIMKYGQVETEKLYFSSGEAAKQIGISVDILHSWEKEFPGLNPKKNANGKRIYKQSDIEFAKEIKENAPQTSMLPKKTKTVKKNDSNNSDNANALIKIRNDLQSILKSIKIPSSGIASSRKTNG